MDLLDNLQPTDFAGAECRVSGWVPYEHYDREAYRVWLCRSSSYWFLRHEWLRTGANQSEFEDWKFYGYYPHKTWPEHMKPAPNLEDL